MQSTTTTSSSSSSSSLGTNNNNNNDILGVNSIDNGNGERQHPLRTDPLNLIPDAVRVPRRPRYSPTSPSSSLSQQQQQQQSQNNNSRRRLFSLAATSSDRRAFQLSGDYDRLRDIHPDDPLRSALVEQTEIQQPYTQPPAGHAFATDVDALLSPHHDKYENPYQQQQQQQHQNRGIILPKLDITVLSAETHEGSAAGVYIVQSKRSISENDNHNHNNNTNSKEKQQKYSSSSSNSCREPTTTSISQQQSHSDTTLINQDKNNINNDDNNFLQVRRSLADFSWLHRRLTSNFDGVIVPSLPAMTFLGRLTHGYAHDTIRRRGLLKFLVRLSRHPVLCSSDEVINFMGMNGEESWNKFRSEQDNDSNNNINNNNLLNRRNWGENLVYQTSKKVNQGLVWLLDQQREQTGSQQNGDSNTSAKARFHRLQHYVNELGNSLNQLRMAIGKVAKDRASEQYASEKLQHEFALLARREGGKFASYFDNDEMNTNEEDIIIINNSSVPQQQRQCANLTTEQNRNNLPPLYTSSSQQHQQRSVHGSSSISATTMGSRDTTTRSNVQHMNNNFMTTTTPSHAPSHPTRTTRTTIVSLPSPPPSTSSTTSSPTSTMLTSSKSSVPSNVNTNSNSNSNNNDPSSRLDLALSVMDTTDNLLSLSGCGSALSSRVVDEVVSDYEDRARGAKRILSARQEEQESYERALSNYIRLRDRLETTSNSLNDDEMDRLVKQVEDASNRLAYVRKHYQAVAVRTTDELRRLRIDLHEDLTQGLELFAREMGKEHAKEANNWFKLADSLANYRNDPPTVPVSVPTPHSTFLPSQTQTQTQTHGSSSSSSSASPGRKVDGK